MITLEEPNEFIQENKQKINEVTPLNPSIQKDDEWKNEDFWDEEGKKGVL